MLKEEEEVVRMSLEMEQELDEELLGKGYEFS